MPTSVHSFAEEVPVLIRLLHLKIYLYEGRSHYWYGFPHLFHLRYALDLLMIQYVAEGVKYVRVYSHTPSSPDGLSIKGCGLPREFTSLPHSTGVHVPVLSELIFFYRIMVLIYPGSRLELSLSLAHCG